MIKIKVPKAVKLPSGKWRVQFQVAGKRRSVTADTRAEAKARAEQKMRDILNGIEEEKKSPLTVGKAIDRYISEKSGALSASTIRGYRTVRKNYLGRIMNVNISDLTQRQVQLAIGDMVQAGKSPKTVRNAHGLLSSVLEEYRPKFVLKTRLPQKKKYEVRIFTEDEMQRVLQASKGNKYELPILLAAWLGLRMSEIRGIKFADIHAGRIHIQRAIVSGEKGPVEKGTKTTSGDRWIKLPQEILDLIMKQDAEHRSDYICPYTHSQIYKGFINICKEAGVEPCRFHDLRHFAASESLALGVPDKYSMKRMGHKTDNMLKTVYQHTMRDKEDEFSDVIDEKMSELYKNAHENAHENEKTQ